MLSQAETVLCGLPSCEFGCFVFVAGAAHKLGIRVPGEILTPLPHPVPQSAPPSGPQPAVLGVEGVLDPG